MEQLAQGLASLGRNGDSMLVHMTPKEVQGLQQLALAKGGSLTINPQTGLPEAFNLGDVFEFAAPILGGMAFGPIGAGLAGGLTSYMKTGDLGQALLRGGLGWGLGSLAQGFGDIGEKSILDAASNAANQTGDLAARNVMGTDLMGSNLGPTPSEFARPENFMQNPYSAEGIRYQVAQGTPLEQVAQSAKDAATNATSMPALDVGSKFSAGLGKVTSSPSEAWNFIKENKYPIGAASLAAASMMAPQPPASAGSQAVTRELPQYTWDAVNRRYVAAPPRTYTTFNAAGGGSVPNTFPQSNIEQMAYSKSSANPMPTNVVGIPSSDYDARINQQGDVFTAAAGAYIPKSKTANTEIYKEVFDPDVEQQDDALMALIAKLSRNPATQYAAQGGTIKMADGGLFDGLINSPAFSQLIQASIQPQPVKYSYNPTDQHYTRMAHGGIASLGGEYAAGGKLLQGPGDGMSDSIPAVIKGAKPQRAALAQGEFVVPADVVSHLGNGSTDAGAKRLYAMMDKVRMARTGNKKQGRQINPEKFMPA